MDVEKRRGEKEERWRLLLRNGAEPTRRDDKEDRAFGSGACQRAATGRAADRRSVQQEQAS